MKPTVRSSNGHVTITKEHHGSQWFTLETHVRQAQVYEDELRKMLDELSLQVAEFYV